MSILRLILLAVSLSLTSTLASADVVNINTADAETLAQTVSGIGPSKAEAIVRYREEFGAFTSVEDLTRVNGIGEKLMERIRDSVTVGSSPSSAN